MPLTRFQRDLLAVVGPSRTPDSYLAGGAALHVEPGSLLEQLKRKGRYLPEDVARLDLAHPFDLIEAKVRWLAALESAHRFVESRPPSEIGCLYFAKDTSTFVAPSAGTDLVKEGIAVHFGQPGGVLPRASK